MSEMFGGSQTDPSSPFARTAHGSHVCTCWRALWLGVAMAKPAGKCLNYLFILWRIVMRNTFGESMCK